MLFSGNDGMGGMSNNLSIYKIENNEKVHKRPCLCHNLSAQEIELKVVLMYLYSGIGQMIRTSVCNGQIMCYG